MNTNENVAATNAAGFDTPSDNVFSRIAERYDLLCDLFSFGLHRIWKRRMVRKIVSIKAPTMLDVAAGTGDIALRVAADRDSAQTAIVISDICPQMLEVAKRRAKVLRRSLQFMILDAHRLNTIPDNSVDLFSMSLGLKICDRHQAMREAVRVLKPGGTFISLEASSIKWRWLHKIYLLYMSLCMPTIGWLATGGDASAYKYLLEGVREFPGAEALSNEMQQLGFINVEFERISLGIVAIHTANKPAIY